MKTTENGPVQYQVARPRLGLYLGLGFAGAVGLALGLGGKVVWQRLAVSQVYPTQPASSVSVVDPAKQSGPNPAEKQLVAEAFTDAFGPPAGLPTGLAQQASELTGDEQGKQVVSQVRFTEAEPMAAPAGDLSFGFCQPGTSSAEHLTLRGAGLTSAAGVEGTILLEPREFGHYPCYPGNFSQHASNAVALGASMPGQIRPIHIRTIGPDGLEKVGIDFERIEWDFHGAASQPVVQAGFILASGQTAVAGGDSRQSGGGSGGMAKVGPTPAKQDSDKTGNDTGMLGAEEHQPLVGSFTTEFEDGYLRLPEELAGWVVEGKIYIAPGPEGGLRMATLEDLEQMFFIENEHGMEGKEERETGPSLRRSARRFYGLMTHCSVEEDEEGKLWIPLGDALTKQASLKGEAVIVGMRTHAEIWSKSAWEAEINGHKPTPKGLELQAKPLELQKVESRAKVAGPGK